MFYGKKTLSEKEFDYFFELSVKAVIETLDEVEERKQLQNLFLSERRQMLPQGMQTKNNNFTTYYDDNDRVGFSWTTLEKEEDRLILANIIVDGAYRRKGYARQILQSIEQEAKECGVSRIALIVVKSNDVAIHLYEKCGYQYVGDKNGFEQKMVKTIV